MLLRYHLLLRLAKILKTAVTGQDKKVTSVFVDNVLSLLEKLEMLGKKTGEMWVENCCQIAENSAILLICSRKSYFLRRKLIAVPLSNFQKSSGKIFFRILAGIKLLRNLRIRDTIIPTVHSLS